MAYLLSAILADTSNTMLCVQKSYQLFSCAPRKGGIEKDLWIGWVEPVCGEDWKCQVGSAARPVALPAGRHYRGREIPSFLIFSCKVERFIPRRAAAPFGPPTTQPVSRRAPRMCSRSASASVTAAAAGARSEERRVGKEC